MNQFNQHNAILSLEQALVPTAGLIDSRTEADNLRLLVDFASLFNFYDQTNKINGNWSPFLLKDPVFLVASIAKTSFQKAYSLFINTCLQLDIALQKKTNYTFISNAFNQLFDQLILVFQTIERWTHYMQQSSMVYNLKTYVIQQVQEKQSAILWALLSLKSKLHHTNIIPNIKPVDTFAFENYDQKIWKENKGKRPYWELLNLKFSPKDNATSYVFEDFITVSKKLETLLKEGFSAIFKEVIVSIEELYIAFRYALETFFSTLKHLVEEVIVFIKEAAAFVSKVIEKIIDELKEKFESTEDETVSNAVKKILADFDAIRFLLEEITTDKHSYENFKTFIATIANTLKKILIDIVEFIIASGEWVFEIIKELSETIILEFKILGEEIIAALEMLLNFILRKDIFNGLKETGKSVFGFYSNCISYAETELETVQNVPGHFPDTILLRTFTSLLKTYQNQINSLSEKHLNFYYDDILKQSPKTVSPDTVFVASNLAKTTATFQLPKNTVFTAGLDTNKQEILFETTKNNSLNPAKIANAYVLSQKKIDANDSELYFQKLPPVNVLTKEEDGSVKTWKTFGSQSIGEGTYSKTAIAFGSPLLYLTAATSRVITFSFTLSSSTFTDILKENTTFYLSTEKAWFKILAKQITFNFTTEDYKLPMTINRSLQMTITLLPTDPVIAAFKKNPDGYTSDWPLFKMEFSQYQDLANPPKIKTLDINILVTGLQNFQLYNDFGQLNAKKPFQPLGPSPTADQSFMVGNAEIFSKPVNAIKIHLTWNKFLDTFNFKTYYCQYNKYEEGKYSLSATTCKEQASKGILCKFPDDCKPDNTETAVEKKSSKSFFSSIGDLFTSTNINELQETQGAEETSIGITNESFQVSFNFLENGLWKSIENAATDQNLFDTTNLNNVRSFDFSNFQNTQKSIDPTVQQTPLVLTDKSTTGFLRMKLTAPSIGFGVSEYPNVVGAIAIYNAGIIAAKIKNSSSTLLMVQPPNLPFVPTVSSFSGDYTAAASYDFSKNNQTYPLESFYNTPFENYKVYDNTNGIITKNTTLGNPIQTQNPDCDTSIGLPLAPLFSSKGQLFLELQDVIAPAKVSFYFELARTYIEGVVPTNEVTYAYLSTDGWKTLTSIEDGTNGFTCSGIITINIPSDITTTHETIAGNNFWIAIGAVTNPDNFPETSFLKTNGITLQRIIPSNDFSTATPQIKATTITSPKTAIPAIAATVQPFASFGGKAAETNQQMNARVSTRLKTKDRLLTAEDFFNVIRLQFPEVYYSKTIYKAKKVSTYVLKRVSDVTETNAFVPLLGECNELEIQHYIKQRVSAFASVAVQNFQLNYVVIAADIIVQDDQDVTTVAKEINNGINVFLAPWITSAQAQITIDTGLNTAQLASFITSYDSILEVKSISLQVVSKNYNPAKLSAKNGKQEIAQTDGIVLVPSLNNLTKNSLITYQL